MDWVVDAAGGEPAPGGAQAGVGWACGGGGRATVTPRYANGELCNPEEHQVGGGRWATITPRYANGELCDPEKHQVGGEAPGFAGLPAGSLRGPWRPPGRALLHHGGLFRGAFGARAEEVRLREAEAGIRKL